VRIPLDKSQGKRQSRRRRGRRRTFETDIARPSLQPRRRVNRPREPERDGAEPPRHTEPQATHGQPTERQHGEWQTVVARLPAALLLGGLIALIFYVSVAEQFFIYDAKIIGSHHIDRDKIYQAAGVHEQNIFWVRPERVSDAVTSLVGIRSAQVHCSLPAELTITVTERKPVVLWRSETQAGDLWLDEEGIVLPYPGVISETVFVLGSSERDLSEGDRLEPDGIVPSVQQIAASLPEVKLFEYDQDHGLSFTQTTPHGSWPVYLGDSKDIERKVQIVRALTDYFNAEKTSPAYIDVRWAEYPVYGKAGASADLSGE
jgi:hypothetical protein